MDKRKQSITTLSFASRQDSGRGYFLRSEDEIPSKPAGDTATTAKGSGDSLLEVCREIAGALMRRYLETGDPGGTRGEIVEHLVAVSNCDHARAQLLADLAIELLRVEAYGRYRRDPLELSLLITRAGGGLEDPGTN